MRIFRHDQYLTKLKLSEEDGNCWLDLTPYMHSNPYRVPLNASLPSIFHLFRGLGLRHVVVVDDENKVLFTFFFSASQFHLQFYIKLEFLTYYMFILMEVFLASWNYHSERSRKIQRTPNFWKLCDMGTFCFGFPDLKLIVIFFHFSFVADEDFQNFVLIVLAVETSIAFKDYEIFTFSLFTEILL